MAVSRKTNDAPKGVNLDRLKGLAERWEAKKSKADDARSDLGLIAKEVEDFGFNRAAFKLTMKLRSMEPDKRNDFISSLNAYADYFGIFQPDLLGDIPTSVGGIGAAEPNENVANLQGKEAGKSGAAIATNPHAEGGPAHTAWNAGWQRGQAEKVKREIKTPLSPDTETRASA